MQLALWMGREFRMSQRGEWLLLQRRCKMSLAQSFFTNWSIGKLVYQIYANWLLAEQMFGIKYFLDELQDYSLLKNIYVSLDTSASIFYVPSSDLFLILV